MNYDYSFKIATIGSAFVGKSAIVKRFCDAAFYNNMDTTIGVDFTATYLELNNKKIKFQIWDTAGQESYASIIRSYYKGVAGIVLVYDVSDRSSFKNLTFWLHEINNNKDANHKLPIVLVGHKIDKQIRQVSFFEAQKFAETNKLTYVEASAKTNNNITNIFSTLAEKILINLKNNNTIGIRRNPVVELNSNIELSSNDKRVGDGVFACCCIS